MLRPTFHAVSNNDRDNHTHRWFCTAGRLDHPFGGKGHWYGNESGCWSLRERRCADDLGAITDELAAKIADAVATRADELIAKEGKREDLIANLQKQLQKGKRPSIWIDIAERHVGQTTIDPAAETEFAVYCQELGFKVIDSDSGARSAADVIISGEGVSEFAARNGNLISVKARLEVKAIDRQSMEVIGTTRHTAIGVDLSEQLAGKSALQDAAARSAQELLVRVANQKPRKPKKDAE
jgi:hypothetical protein